MAVWRLSGTEANKTPLWEYAPSSFTYLMAMYASNIALQYVTYPTQVSLPSSLPLIEHTQPHTNTHTRAGQVLAKSCKPIPVMIVGACIGRTFPLQKYLNVVIITAGIALFLCPNVTGATAAAPDNYWYGVSWLLLSLFLDGTHTHAKPTALAISRQRSSRGRVCETQQCELWWVT